MNPRCASCGHVRSAHDFDARYRHKRCSHGDATGMCDCESYVAPKEQP